MEGEEGEGGDRVGELAAMNRVGEGNDEAEELAAKIKGVEVMDVVERGDVLGGGFKVVMGGGEGDRKISAKGRGTMMVEKKKEGRCLASFGH